MKPNTNGSNVNSIKKTLIGLVKNIAKLPSDIVNVRIKFSSAIGPKIISNNNETSGNSKFNNRYAIIRNAITTKILNVCPASAKIHAVQNKIKIRNKKLSFNIAIYTNK